MEGYKVDISIEPKDNYEKAKKDLLEAIESFERLSPQQKAQLINEVFILGSMGFFSQKV